MIVRTRMAPSPTGEFHIGSLRTLLYNYALAKKFSGQFILRIEDTDQKRYVDGAANRIYESIRSYGLDWDEGPLVGGSFGPYIQSERLNIYQEYIQRLIENKKAYYCFCTSERLNELRDRASKENRVFKYDKTCLHLDESTINSKIQSGESYTIRMNVPADEVVEYEDLVLGKVSFPTNDIDDQILIKSDGFPTYHFAVVVDDYLMKVTHILRGCEWVPSTPKHVLLYKFFGFEVPKFGHTSNLKYLGSTKKMSKRDGTTNSYEFLRQGYLPEAVLNHLMLLGWNSGTDKEIYSVEDFIQEFDLKGLHKTDLVTFSFDKLNWFNNYYLQNLSSEEFITRIKYWSEKFNMPCNINLLEERYSKENVSNIVKLSKERLNVFSEFDENVNYFLHSPINDTVSLGKYSDNPKQVLEFFYDAINNSSDFSFENLDKNLHNIVKENNFSMKEYFMTLRLAITGLSVTPPIIEIIAILGKTESLERIQNSINQF